MPINHAENAILRYPLCIDGQQTLDPIRAGRNSERARCDEFSNLKPMRCHTGINSRTVWTSFSGGTGFCRNLSRKPSAPLNRRHVNRAY
jgi:hypothetical protein